MPCTRLRQTGVPIIGSSGSSDWTEQMSSRTESPIPQPVAAPAGVSRWSTAGLLIGWAACVLLLAYFLEVRPRERTRAPSVETVATVEAGFPAPPQGAVVYSRQLGRNALALGVVPRAGEVLMQASVVGPQGEGVSGLDVTFGNADQTTSGRPCGDGCYRAVLPAEASPRALDVIVEGAASTRWSVPLPAQWPPRDAAPLVGAAGRAWRSLHSLAFDETLGSGLKNVVRSSWTAEAPDRLTYRIAGGSSAVVIGKRRWDKAPGGTWKESSQSPLRQPIPPWVRVTDAYVVGKTTSAGRPAFVVTFFDPNVPAWFRLVVDRRTHRTLDLRMVATAHFMHDRLHSFNEAPATRPPTPS
jgi:hypothetical protein